MSAPYSYYDAMLAEILRRIDAAGMTRKDIAAGLGISQRLLGRKLSGEALLAVKEVSKLARVLGCRMSELVA